jgi:hypothetical protein
VRTLRKLFFRVSWTFMTYLRLFWHQPIVMRSLCNDITVVNRLIKNWSAGIYGVSHKSRAIGELCYLAKYGKCKREKLLQIMCIQSQMLEFLPRTSRYNATLFILSIVNVTAMLPCLHDSEKGMCFQSFLWYCVSFTTTYPYSGNIPLSLSCQRGNIAITFYYL